MKNNKGITLIALVITIIVLLILAVVSIAMLTGSNGILTQATNAANTTETAEIKERINMELAALYGSALAQTNPTGFAQADVTAADNNLDDSYTVTKTGTDPITSVEISNGSFSGSVTITDGEVSVDYVD